MAKIHLLSDLHLEMRKNLGINTLIQEADILVVAGDLHVGRTNVAKYLNYFAMHYKYVVYVLGNHELYHGLGLNDFDQENFIKHLKPNVFFLNPGTVILEGITFIGAPLWTNFRGNDIARKIASAFINDFKRAKVKTKDYIDAYDYQLAYMKGMYEQTEGKRVFVTHFMPAKDCVNPKWLNVDSTTAYLNYYFCNDLGTYISTLKDCTWLFGHTHDDTDVTIGTTRCIANPLGYPGEKQYKPFILEL